MSLLQLGGSMLDADAFRRSEELLSTHSAAEVAAGSGLDTERVRLLPAGLLILQAAAALFGVPLRVNSGGLREGVLLDPEAPWRGYQ